MKEALLVIVFAPFAGAFLLALLGRALPRRVVEGIACASVTGSFVGALYAFLAAVGRGERESVVPEKNDPPLSK